MKSGVGRSGSPTPKEITSTPAALAAATFLSISAKRYGGRAAMRCAVCIDEVTPLVRVLAASSPVASCEKIGGEGAVGHLAGGAGHPHRASRRPLQLERAAAQLDHHPLAGEPADLAGHRDRAGPRATGERLADAAFPGPLAQGVLVDHLDELDVGAVREGRV